eukprot:2767883-Amphidinium_carterae.5
MPCDLVWICVFGIGSPHCKMSQKEEMCYTGHYAEIITIWASLWIPILQRLCCRAAQRWGMRLLAVLALSEWGEFADGLSPGISNGASSQAEKTSMPTSAQTCLQPRQQTVSIVSWEAEQEDGGEWEDGQEDGPVLAPDTSRR